VSFAEIINGFCCGRLDLCNWATLMDLTRSSITPAISWLDMSPAGFAECSWPLSAPGRPCGSRCNHSLSGFGHSLAQGVIRAVEQKGLLGAFSGGIESTAVGVAAAVVFGYAFAVLFNPRS